MRGVPNAELKSAAEFQEVATVLLPVIATDKMTVSFPDDDGCKITIARARGASTQDAYDGWYSALQGLRGHKSDGAIDFVTRSPSGQFNYQDKFIVVREIRRPDASMQYMA